MAARAQGAWRVAVAGRTVTLGSELVIGYTKEMRDAMFAGNRWRGKMFADEPGCYVHYLPTHGPNFWDNVRLIWAVRFQRATRELFRDLEDRHDLMTAKRHSPIAILVRGAPDSGKVPLN